jgi:hypothetical protein
MARRSSRRKSGRSYATTKRPGNIHQNTATSTATTKASPIAKTESGHKGRHGWATVQDGGLAAWRAGPIWNEGGKQK